MTVPSLSNLELKATLLKQQKHKLKQRFLWRSILLSSFVTSLLAITIIPHSKIKHPAQVSIKGTDLVGKPVIYRLLNIQYSEFIWQIPSHQLIYNLESIPAIAHAKISKQIFPPSLQVFIQERKPVAIAVPAPGSSWGFLDAQGIWLDPKYYEDNGANIVSSGLKVINFQSSHSSSWSKVYQLIEAYPSLKIGEVKWDNSRNLYLKSTLGMIYLGSDTSRLSEQFAAIAKLKNLPKHLNPSEIYYIDLTNPDRYSIQKYP